MQQALKVAYIGGGQQELGLCAHAGPGIGARAGRPLWLYDIDRAAARRNAALAPRIFEHRDAKSRWRARVAHGLTQALTGADFVICSIEPGPVEMRYADLEIPRRYGILQPVGDTTGPGGICRALRAAPVYAELAHRIMRHCPEAWVINYTNPMTLCTAALYAAEPRIKALGCCHEVFGTQRWLAERVARLTGEPKPPREAIHLDVAGVNHFTLATAARWKDVDLLQVLREDMDQPRYFADRTRTARRRLAAKAWFAGDHLIACDLLRRFGVLGAAGDRHLAEFVPWYLTSEQELWRWGVVLTPYAYRLWHSRTFKRVIPDGAPLTPSGEEGVAIMKALRGCGDWVTPVNLPNRGQMPDLPPGPVVETQARIRRDAIKPIAAGQLPPLAAELVRRVAVTQGLTLQAALARDPRRVLEALLSDPLVRLPTRRAEAMMHAMLDHIGWDHANAN